MAGSQLIQKRGVTTTSVNKVRKLPTMLSIGFGQVIKFNKYFLV